MFERFKIMAKPIKETPVLKGKDAKRFTEEVYVVTPESKEAIKKAKITFEKFQKIAVFPI